MSIDDNPYYFGYGTLLSATEMLRYCPSAEVVVTAKAPEHRLEFWAYGPDGERVGCHLADAPGHDAYGIVYRVSASDLAALDIASGVDRGWFERRELTVVTPDGSSMLVGTYFLTEPLHHRTPDAAYTGLVRDGLRTADLPADFVARTTACLDALPPAD